MCLIFVAVDAHPNYPTVIAANRDESCDRPSAPASFWPEGPQLLAGRDLQRKGTSHTAKGDVPHAYLFDIDIETLRTDDAKCLIHK
jgi:uncharacterized protein with NRDE domain